MSSTNPFGDDDDDDNDSNNNLNDYDDKRQGENNLSNHSVVVGNDHNIRNFKNPFENIGDDDTSNINYDDYDDDNNYDRSLDPFANDDNNDDTVFETTTTKSKMTQKHNDYDDNNVMEQATPKSKIMINKHDNYQRTNLHDINYISGQNQNDNNDYSIRNHNNNNNNNSFIDDRSSLNSRLSLSRLSINSTSSNIIAEQQLRQYSLGDGTLEKEGLICPECKIEFKTITELMNHDQKQHYNDRHQHHQQKRRQKHQQQNIWTNLLTKQINNFSNDQSSSSSLQSQMGDQIKGFLNKFLNNSINNGSGNINFKQQPRNMDNSSMKDLNSSNQSEYDQSSDKSLTQQSSDLYNPTFDWKNSMNMGTTKSHYDQFRSIRDKRIERHVFETNNLLIRLDKLLRDYPTQLNDMAKRRKYEKTIVEWIDETIVPLCPYCASKFNILTKKRHHCRLCGAVMCTKCSKFITFSFAWSLINAINMDSTTSSSLLSSTFQQINNDQKQQQQQQKLLLQTIGNDYDDDQESVNKDSPLKSFVKTMSSSISNVSPLIENQENIDKLRVCYDCELLLKIRNEKIQIAHKKLPLVELYEQLREFIVKIDRLVPVYFRMADSINIGESTYQLKDANELKQKITTIGEQTDLLSRKIELYGLIPSDDTLENNDTNNGNDQSSESSKISSRQISLQTSIRRSTIQYLRENLLGLPELPDEKRFEQLKKFHSESIEKRIRFEKQMALMEQEKFRNSFDKQRQEKRQQQYNYHYHNQQQQRNNSKNQKHETIIIGDNEDGFSTNIELWKTMNKEERQSILEESDPLMQQINIIRSYIKQAKDYNRYEEVAILEDNLKELEIEHYFLQQQQQQQDQRPIQEQLGPEQQPEKSTTTTNNPFGDEDDDNE